MTTRVRIDVPHCVGYDVEVEVRNLQSGTSSVYKLMPGACYDQYIYHGFEIGFIREVPHEMVPV